MKIKKAIALMIGLVLIASMALPGTLAVSADQAAANSSLIVADGTEPSAPEGTEASTPEGTEASAPQGTEPSAPEGTEPSAPADGTEPTTMPTEPEAPAFDAQAVYDQLMATETLEEFNGLFDALSDEEVEIFCAWLTENGLTEALEMNDLAGTQELNDVVHVRVVAEPQNVVVGNTRFLFCGNHIRTTFD